MFGGGAGSTALSSFFSFFSLVPLGCCGSWLFILSMLPTIFGSSLSVVLIQYSEALSYIGLGIVFGFTGLSAIRLRKNMAADKQYKNMAVLIDQVMIIRLSQRKRVSRKSLNYGNNLISKFNNRRIALAAISIVSVTITIFIVTYTITPVNFAPARLHLFLRLVTIIIMTMKMMTPT